MAGAKTKVSIRHKGDVNSKITEAQRILGLTVKANETFAEQAYALTNVQMTASMVDTYIRKVYSMPENNTDMSKQSMNTMESIMGLFEGKGKGSTLSSSNGTAWGLYNAVIEFQDYHKNQSLTMKGLESNFLGRGANIKTTALQEALALV
jgi:predicted Zn-dependent protease with MMP-like domain